jgi:hypothetical protein
MDRLPVAARRGWAGLCPTAVFLATLAAPLHAEPREFEMTRRCM